MGDESSTRWQTRSSKYIHRDRWITLRADDCVTPQGIEVSPYYVLEYSDWVHVAALDPEDNIVLIRQYRHGLGEVSLELPAGRMDEKEDDPLVTAARELAEETGFVAEKLQIITQLSPDPGTHANRIHVVLATNARRLRTTSLDSTEDITVEITPYRVALEAALGGVMMHSQQVASLLVALRFAGKLRF